MNRMMLFLSVAALAFTSAMIGTWIGRNFPTSACCADSHLHSLLHDQLHLDPTQKSKVELLETQFAVQRQTLDSKLRVDNKDLALAIESEHGYGPRVIAAVDESHRAMDDLQKATLEHIFAMRSVLRPDQAAKFDAAIVKALTTSKT